MNIAISPWSLMSETHSKVIPTVRGYLEEWKFQAQQIPTLELRKQALDSLEMKQFIVKVAQSMGCLPKVMGRKQSDSLLLIKRLVII